MDGIRQNTQGLKKKRIFRSKLYSWPILILLFALVIFLGHGVWNMYAKVRTSEAQLAQAQAELDELKERRKELENKIAYIETETGIEEHLRREFDVAKEGEQVVVILDNGEEVEEVISFEEKGFWERFKEWFK